MHNIRYGRLDASDEEVKIAADLANIGKTIESLPDKWQTKVGERGLMISGGEKQRLAVARLLLKDPRILFFDEAVSLHFSYLLRLDRSLTMNAIDFGAGFDDGSRFDAKYQFNSSLEIPNERLYRSSVRSSSALLNYARLTVCIPTD